MVPVLFYRNRYPGVANNPDSRMKMLDMEYTSAYEFIIRDTRKYLKVLKVKIRKYLKERSKIGYHWPLLFRRFFLNFVQLRCRMLPIWQSLSISNVSFLNPVRPQPFFISSNFFFSSNLSVQFSYQYSAFISICRICVWISNFICEPLALRFSDSTGHLSPEKRTSS